MARTITSANSTFQLSLPDVYGSVPQLLQGYAVDDAFDAEDVDIAEAQMGVDGLMSAGYTPAIITTAIHFQSDSPSISVFDNWYADMVAQQEVLYAQALISAPSLSKEWTLTNGVLVKYKPIPAAKKVFQPQAFTVKWEAVSASAI